MKDSIIAKLEQLKKDEETILSNLHATRGAIFILNELLNEDLKKDEKTDDSGDKK